MTPGREEGYPGPVTEDGSWNGRCVNERTRRGWGASRFACAGPRPPWMSEAPENASQDLPPNSSRRRELPAALFNLLAPLDLPAPPPPPTALGNLSKPKSVNLQEARSCPYLRF
ncbi:hypothetical protein SKAU_G00258160 [Synaphobranchus kaupii]|uniref:Uncharacterized protein n=1 Tax=Synaphobranchus kaupii TaxID=118154 RepID=A0A9Q1F4A8_SYNKA|nr:hypothetical protein SKAU_G00258160 [Synaphobranchus kaupii]